MSTKELGKIQGVKFGLGGYQDAMLGIHFTLGGDGWGIGNTMSTWDCNKIEHTNSCKWTEKERSATYDEIMRYISGLLSDAKVDSIDKLKGIPIEVTLSGDSWGGSLESWRILKEVL